MRISPEQKRRKLPTAVKALGLGSLFMDTGSELIHSLLPVYLATTLGTGIVTIGILEGIAEATAAITKVFSGVISDFFRKRKPLIILGYGLGALTKPVFPLARSVQWIFAARFTDRFGKGLRGAPRDALIADITSPTERGAAYGLRQTLDSIGAFAGPLLAVMFMIRFGNDIRKVLWVASVPAFASVLVLLLFIHEPAKYSGTAAKKQSGLFQFTKNLPFRFWGVTILGSVFTLARFSEAFLVLRAQSVGLAPGLVPVVMIVMNLVYSAAAYPAGIAADRINTTNILILGLVILILADIVLSAAGSIPAVMVGAGMWGLHMGFTQGLLSKLVSLSTPERLRGTAFGIFNLVTGICMLLSSVIAGTFWEIYGPSGTFAGGALFALLTVIGLLIFRLSTHSGPTSSR